MMNKTLRAREPESSRKRFYGFRQVWWQSRKTPKKKSRRCRRL
jgi:hypothetical protein